MLYRTYQGCWPSAGAGTGEGVLVAGGTREAMPDCLS